MSFVSGNGNGDSNGRHGVAETPGLGDGESLSGNRESNEGNESAATTSGNDGGKKDEEIENGTSPAPTPASALALVLVSKEVAKEFLNLFLPPTNLPEAVNEASYKQWAVEELLQIFGKYPELLLEHIPDSSLDDCDYYADTAFARMLKYNFSTEHINKVLCAVPKSILAQYFPRSIYRLFHYPQIFETFFPTLLDCCPLIESTRGRAVPTYHDSNFPRISRVSKYCPNIDLIWLLEKFLDKRNWNRFQASVRFSGSGGDLSNSEETWAGFARMVVDKILEKHVPIKTLEVVAYHMPRAAQELVRFYPLAERLHIVLSDQDEQFDAIQEWFRLALRLNDNNANPFNSFLFGAGTRPEYVEIKDFQLPNHWTRPPTGSNCSTITSMKLNCCTDPDVDYNTPVYQDFWAEIANMPNLCTLHLHCGYTCPNLDALFENIMRHSTIQDLSLYRPFVLSSDVANDFFFGDGPRPEDISFCYIPNPLYQDWEPPQYISDNSQIRDLSVNMEHSEPAAWIPFLKELAKLPNLNNFGIKLNNIDDHFDFTQVIKDILLTNSVHVFGFFESNIVISDLDSDREEIETYLETNTSLTKFTIESSLIHKEDTDIVIAIHRRTILNRHGIAKAEDPTTTLAELVTLLATAKDYEVAWMDMDFFVIEYDDNNNITGEENDQHMDSVDIQYELLRQCPSIWIGEESG